jgi:hypothetical protein
MVSRLMNTMLTGLLCLSVVCLVDRSIPARSPSHRASTSFSVSPPPTIARSRFTRSPVKMRSPVFLLACVVLSLLLAPTWSLNFLPEELLLKTRNAVLEHTYSSGREPIRFTQNEIVEWLATGLMKEPRITDDEDILPRVDLSQPDLAMPELKHQLLRRAELEARKILGGGDPLAYKHPSSVGADSYPYFGFIPQYLGGAKTDGLAVSWNASSTSCFQENSATLTPNDGNSTSASSWTLSVTTSSATTLLCSDFYLFATLDGLILHTFSSLSPGTTNFTWTLSPQASEAIQWDLSTKGVRVFRFQSNVIDMLTAVIDTALLFEAEATVGVSPAAAARNIDFLTKYSGFSSSARQNVTEIILDESEISSGDFFGVMRLDGTDPMLAWAMGSTTGEWEGTGCEAL